jgi:hypothetical protein
MIPSFHDVSIPESDLLLTPLDEFENLFNLSELHFLDEEL